MSEHTDLAEKMLTRADADGLPAEHAIRAAALEFDEAAKGYFGVPQTCGVKKFTGAWARARRAWSDYSGEPLL